MFVLMFIEVCDVLAGNYVLIIILSLFLAVPIPLVDFALREA